MRNPIGVLRRRAELKAPRKRLPGGRRRWIRSSMDWLAASLLTVFYGLGIFTANAAYERRPRPNGRGKQPLARGYLREAALSEALAYYALLRGERNPDWDRHLDPPVRRVMRNQLSVLTK